MNIRIAYYFFIIISRKANIENELFALLKLSAETINIILDYIEHYDYKVEFTMSLKDIINNSMYVYYNFCVDIPKERLAYSFTSSGFHPIVILNMNTRKREHTLLGHNASIKCLTPLSDEHIVSGSEDTHLKIWNINTGDCSVVTL